MLTDCQKKKLFKEILSARNLHSTQVCKAASDSVWCYQLQENINITVSPITQSQGSNLISAKASRGVVQVC